ncbi:MAG: hypothetical protein J3R72DRAFT_209738 [Linnemannia gamsii]|nr:MAG: hypothetical protein J3R72DRAFT_209738 [Linnemannia gamsii]
MGLYNGLRSHYIPQFLYRCLHLHTLTWPGWPVHRPSSPDPHLFIFNLSRFHHTQGGSFIKHFAFNLGEFHDRIQIPPIFLGPGVTSEGVETFRLTSTHNSSNGLLLSLTTRWADTLSILEFGPTARIWRADTNIILRTCAHLTVYKVECVQGETCLTVGKFHSEPTANATFWICRGLKVLPIGYVDFGNHESTVNDEVQFELDEDDVAFSENICPVAFSENICPVAFSENICPVALLTLPFLELDYRSCSHIVINNNNNNNNNDNDNYYKTSPKTSKQTPSPKYLQTARRLNMSPDTHPKLQGPTRRFHNPCTEL